MATFPVRLFRVPTNTSVAIPPAVEEVGFAVTASTYETARAAVIARLAELGQYIRSISHTTDGGFVAVSIPPPFGAELPPTPVVVPVEPDIDARWGGDDYGGGEWGG